jgi:hypothetical protein
VGHLLERYDALLRLSLTDPARLQRITQAQGRVVLALDGCNLTLAMRCSGSSVIASPGKSSSPAVCCPRPRQT